MHLFRLIAALFAGDPEREAAAIWGMPPPMPKCKTTRNVVDHVKELVQRLTESGEYRTITVRYSNIGIAVMVAKGREDSEGQSTELFFEWGD